MAGIEHTGIGLIAKKWTPQVHLAVLMVSTEIIDILWIGFMIFGMNEELNHGLTHSLLMSALWSALAGIIAAGIYKGIKEGIVIGLMVFSHWIVDFITHPMTFLFPQAFGLPLYPGSPPVFGLGVYRTLPGIIIFWVLIMGTGIILYASHRKTHHRAPREEG